MKTSIQNIERDDRSSQALFFIQQKVQCLNESDLADLKYLVNETAFLRTYERTRKRKTVLRILLPVKRIRVQQRKEKPYTPHLRLLGGTTNAHSENAP